MSQILWTIQQHITSVWGLVPIFGMDSWAVIEIVYATLYLRGKFCAFNSTFQNTNGFSVLKPIESWPPLWWMCFLRSPELDLSEVTVEANKIISGPSDMSSAISMPVKMLLAPLQQNNSSTWPHWSTVMPPWCHCGSSQSQTSYRLMLSMKHGRVWRNDIMHLLFITRIIPLPPISPQYVRGLTTLTETRKIVS